MDPVFTRELILLVLLVKILAAASIASVLARSGYFRKLLFQQDKTIKQQIEFGVLIGSPLFVGAALRVILKYQAPELSFEGAILAGVLGGPFAGMIAGGMGSVPAMFHNEILSMPVLVAAGAFGGWARYMAPDKEYIWTFSPFFDLNLYRWFRKRFGYARGDWQMFFFVWIIAIEAGRIHLGREFPGKLFYVHNAYPPVEVAICFATVACVAIPITVWKNTRNEMLLEQQQRLLMEARLSALTAQINPHFLFNTLNSIASLVRTDPDTARTVIIKLSNILRKLLKKTEALSPLREELAFIDDYLSIEVIRFGHHKLKIEKEIEEGSLSEMVPSMMLQPIIENSIKHGLSPKLEGGVIQIRSSRQNGWLLLEVKDNGVGIPTAKLSTISELGIGISNVQERLRVLYGSQYTMTIDSPPGQGTSIQIGIPLVQV